MNNRLMIGNILRDKRSGSFLRVDELDSKGKVVLYLFDRSKFPLKKGWQAEPVPLTPELLKACGFALYGGKVWSDPINNCIHLVESDGKISMISYYDNEHGLYQEVAEVASLHDLQILYQLLSGESLLLDVTSDGQLVRERDVV